ncbi:hypothetical protein PENSPDRAFT_146975 [Peniophora sp. CONT]|nr:hypothetical protein PENSPDRAFT_146975 [Peniophora sp. CONT]
MMRRHREASMLREDEDEELGPMPSKQSFSSTGGGAHEVEYAHGCSLILRGSWFLRGVRLVRLLVNAN